MANEEQLAILKQGVKVWNKWREDNPKIRIDLSKTNLEGANLEEANLEGTELWDAILISADLSGASLSRANLIRANFKGAELRADLRSADLFDANLSGANLSEAHLVGTNFQQAEFIGSNFSKAWLGYTVFGRSDLSQAIGLESAIYIGPSIVSTDTFDLSKGNISEVFLRGCGLSDTDIEYAKLSNPEWSNNEINKILYKIYDLRATQALQVSPLFISYSHADSVFVDKLESQLNAKGIRFWRDIHEMKAGPLEKQIDRAISQNRTVLLILSQNSIKSDWVEHEVRTARGLGKETGRDVLCPIALDDSWKSSPWPKRVMEHIMEYNILDFSDWEDDVKFGDMFRKLIDGLELFYKG